MTRSWVLTTVYGRENRAAEVGLAAWERRGLGAEGKPKTEYLIYIHTLTVVAQLSTY